MYLSDRNVFDLVIMSQDIKIYVVSQSYSAITLCRRYKNIKRQIRGRSRTTSRFDDRRVRNSMGNLADAIMTVENAIRWFLS